MRTLGNNSCQNSSHLPQMPTKTSTMNPMHVAATKQHHTKEPEKLESVPMPQIPWKRNGQHPPGHPGRRWPVRTRELHLKKPQVPQACNQAHLSMWPYRPPQTEQCHLLLR
ncbi:uncharacterized protein [Haliotis asinina]|uniref:uncharacterized protein n=1 Tax=Haliotis asinina TaxID=109174 RepID=UPI0035324797